MVSLPLDWAFGHGFAHEDVHTHEGKQDNKDGNGGESAEFDPCAVNGEETSVKRTMTKTMWIVAGLAIACFWPATTHAQAEVAPDDYKAENMMPATPAPPVKADFEGKFSLPFQVQCSRNKLAPGQYTLAVRTEGTGKIVTIHREGGDIVLTARIVTQPSDSGQSALLVRHGPGPRTRTIEGLYLGNLNMTLYLDESGNANPLDKMFASVQRAPIL
jgi:hypothetical protein